MPIFLSPVRYAFNKSVAYALNAGRRRDTPHVVSADRQDDDGTRKERQGFKPQYAVPLKAPRNDLEAQKLYNHIRTVAWYLDSIPLLGKNLPFKVGIDGVIGLIPGVGDYFGLVLGVYQIYLCSLFGLPIQLLLWMVINVVIDCFLGLIPFVGDLLDVAFKANLRNLRSLEDHLSETRGKCEAGSFTLEFPVPDVFLPPSRPQHAVPIPSTTSNGQSRGSFPDFRDGTARRDASRTSASMPDAASIPAVPLALPTSVNTIEEEAEMEEAMDVEGGFDDRPPARPTRSRSPKVTPRPSRESLQIEDAETCRPPRPASPGSTMTPALGGRPSRNSLDTEWLLSGHQHERQRYRSQSPIIGRGPGARGRSVSFHDGISVGDIESDSAGAKAVDAAQAAWKKRRAMYFVVYSAIFCVAYMTSLDANTGYLYLNFACSEFGALASFSTVAIMQQMITAMAKPPIAKLSDVFGRAEAYFFSLGLYMIGYVVVATSASLGGLIGGIVLQSAGNTGVQVLQSIIIADTTTAKWRGLVIGIVNLPYLINFAVAGPLVDLVMSKAGWRWGYGMWSILVPLAATPLLLTLAIGQRRARKAGLVHSNPITGKAFGQAITQLAHELDLVGLILLTSGWLFILLPLTLVSHGSSTTSGAIEYALATGGILLMVFTWWETKASNPIMPYQFLLNRGVVCVCIVGILDFASFYISWTFISSFVQVLKGWDQTKTGYFATTQNVTSTITGIIVGSLMAMTRRFKVLLVGGVIVRLIGVAMMIRYRTADDPTVMLVLCQLLQGIGGGSVAITMQVAVQVCVRHADVAIVTALELLTTEIGAAIGSAIAGSLYTSYLPGKLRVHLPDLPQEELDRIFGSLQAAVQYPLGSEIRTGITHAWVDVMRILCITATAVLLPALFFSLAIPNLSLPDAHGSAITHRRRRASSQTYARTGSERFSVASASPSHGYGHGNGHGQGQGYAYGSSPYDRNDRRKRGSGCGSGPSDNSGPYRPRRATAPAPLSPSSRRISGLPLVADRGWERGAGNRQSTVRTLWPVEDERRYAAAAEEEMDPFLHLAPAGMQSEAKKRDREEEEEEERELVSGCTIDGNDGHERGGRGHGHGHGHGHRDPRGHHDAEEEEEEEEGAGRSERAPLLEDLRGHEK